MAELDPTCWEQLLALGMEEKYEELIQLSHRFLLQATDNDEKATILMGLVKTYSDLDRFGEARETAEILNRLEIQDAGTRLRVEYTEAYLLNLEGQLAGQFEKGIAECAAFIDRNKVALEDPEYRYLYEDIQCRRALALYGLSRLKEALPILREATSFTIEFLSYEQEIRFALGVCLEDANDAPTAIEEFRRVVGFGFKSAFEERALYHLALLYSKSGAFAQTMLQLETILRDFPAQTAALPRGYVYEALSQTCHLLGDKVNAKHYHKLAKSSDRSRTSSLF